MLIARSLAASLRATGRTKSLLRCCSMKIFSSLCFAICLCLVASCAVADSGSVPGLVPEPQCIALGELLPTPSPLSGSCHYKIVEVWRGALSTNAVRVIFWQSTLPSNGCPSRAILLLEAAPGYPSGFHFAAGRDARLGILPFSVALKDDILSRGLEELFATPQDKRLPKERAISIAVKEQKDRGFQRNSGKLQSAADRYNFGWIVQLWRIQHDGSSVQGGHLFVTVGDDGKVKSVMTGL